MSTPERPRSAAANSTRPDESGPGYRIITDSNGRRYRVGESAQDILGRHRTWMMWLPWVALVAISVFEYGFGAAASTLQTHNRWSTSTTFWLDTIWVLFEAGVAFPAGRLRESGRLSARTGMLVAAVMTGIGFFTIANISNAPIAFLGYSVIGGTGAGIIYATSINMVGKWFPDHRGFRTGFVNGGFAYGAVPFIFVFTYWFHPSTYALVLNLIAVYIMAVVFLCGWYYKDPPKYWWPADVDPIEWVEKAKRRRNAAKNPPAVGQFTTAEAMRTRMLPIMTMAFFLIGVVSLFGSTYQVPFAKSLGFGPLVAASSAGVLSVINGVGRAGSGWISDRLGRKNTIILVLLIEAAAQIGLLYTGKAHAEVPFLVMSFVAGFGGGAFFPLFAALVPDYFGENYNASNYGVVYGGKLASSLVGIGVGSSVVLAMGWTASYLIAAGLAVLAAGLSMLMHRPTEAPEAQALPRESPEAAGTAPVAAGAPADVPVAERGEAVSAGSYARRG